MKYMGNKLLNALTALFVIVSIFSCSKEISDDPYLMGRPGIKRHIVGEATLPVAEKAYLDGFKVKWNANDNLNVNGSNLVATSVENGVLAQFEGTAYALQSALDQDCEIYWAVYPTTLAGEYTSAIPEEFQETSLTVSLPVVQTFNSDVRPLNGYNYMAAYASIEPGTQPHFYMKNLCTVLRITLTAATSASNTRASRLEFTSTTSKLSGDFDVDNTLDFTNDASAIGSLYVSLSDGINSYIDIAGGAVVYVLLPAITSGNLTLKIYNTDEKCTTKKISSLTTVRNHVYNTSISGISFDEDHPALFSIDPLHKVTFSPGNLQWSYTNGGTTPTSHAVAGGGTETGTFRFAEHQWNFVGDLTDGNVFGENGVPGAKCSNTKHSHSYNGWLDLFGYGTSGWSSGTYSYSPGSKSTNDVDYRPGLNYANNLTGAYAYADWGIYNEIYNPSTGVTDPPGTWRTPTNDEWVYLFTLRSTPSGARYAKAIVNGVKGVMLFPDDWDPDIYTINSVNIGAVDYTVNVITLSDFQLLEDNGMVFLPAAGNRVGTNVSYVLRNGSYWSSTSYDEKNAHGLYFGDDVKYGGLFVGPGLTHGRSHGRNVRLIRDDL